MADTLQEQLDKQRRTVSYDTYDILVRQLIDLVDEKAINIAPEYQRQFVWDDANQSRFIESIFLGIPIPSLFMATNTDSSWELIDGVQRVSTLIRFCGSDEHLAIIGRDRLRIADLEKLTRFNSKTFAQLPSSVQLGFMMKPLKVTTLNDKSDVNVRFDLFERLNTGGVVLHPQEIRNCIFRGEYSAFLKDLASADDFRAVVTLSRGDQHNGTFEEFVLRFFAFFETYKTFDHDVRDYLNDFMKAKTRGFEERRDRSLFNRTFAVLSEHLPDGIARLPRRTTPVNLYEGIAVGTALAIDAKKLRYPERLPDLLDDEDLRNFSTGATNSQKMVAGRIEYVRDMLSRR